MNTLIRSISFLLLLPLLFSGGALKAQLIVDDNPSAQQLVKNILVGNGVQVSNVQFTGDPIQIGAFDGTAANIPYDSGIVMSTGDCNDAVGPNNSGAMSTSLGNTTGDPDLLSIAQQTNSTSDINDVAIIEFDFTPQGDSVSFDYIFGSDEYLEWVGSAYNDVFGFFISGPGINGPYTNNAVNMAKIPGTNDPVCIGYVNDATNSAYYVNNGDGSTSPYDSDSAYIQADGHTVSLTADCTVTCGKTYHMALKIGDGEDQAYDSWVFLKGGSLSSSGLQVNSQVDFGQKNDSTLWEGCGSATFYAIRQGDLSNSDTVWVETSGSATEGSDYSALPDSLFFSSGQDSTSLTFNTLADNLSEGTEKAVLDLIYKDPSSCNSYDTATVEVYISDPPPLSLSTSNDTLIGECVDSVELWASATGGLGEYSWTWSQGIPNGDSAGWVSPTDTTTYTVTVADTCNASATDSITVNVGEMYAEILPPDTLGCSSTDITLDGSPSSSFSGNISYSWSTSGGNFTSGTNSVTADVDQAGDYTLTVTDPNSGCSDDTTVTVVQKTALDIVVDSVLDATCKGQCDGAAYISVNTGTPPFDYQWDDANNQTTQDATGLCAGVHQVVVTDSNGCSDSVQVLIDEPPALQISTLPDTMICIGGTATLSASASGGTPSYTYHWDNGLGTGQTQTVSPGSDTVYSVYATDANACTSVTQTMRVDYHPPLQVSTSPDDSICPGATTTLSASANGGIGSGYTYDWSNGMSGSSITVATASEQDYVVTLEDACETPAAKDTVTVSMNPLPDVQISGQNLEGCSPLQATLVNATPDSLVGTDCVWDLGDGEEAISCDSVTHTYDEPGCYDVGLTVTSPEGCVDSSSYTNFVCVHPLPTASFTYEPKQTTVQDPGIEFTNQSTGASSYWWNIGGLDTSTEEHPSYEFPGDGPGTYDVCLKAESSQGCRDSICKEVTIDGEFILYVPNAFSPDGDGVNDEFYPVVQGADPQDYHFYVYDRWGEVVFETHNPEARWDGSIKGSQKAQKTDVYVWRLETRNKYNGETIIRKGHVTLIR